MRTFVAMVVVLASTSAMAKPLPKGLSITIDKDGRLFAKRGDVTVPVFDPSTSSGARTFNGLKSAKLSDDGATIVMSVGDCAAMREARDDLEASLAEVEARIENVIGMKAHLKKKYADAIPHFAAAAKGDLGRPVYATNLLSSQSMANKLDDADHTIATYGIKNVAWFAWRLAVDSDLAALRGRDSVKPFTAVQTTKTTVNAIGDGIGASPLGLFANVEVISLGGNGPGATDLVVFQLATNAPQMRLPLSGGACVPQSEAFPCSKTDLARLAQQERAADGALAALGFQPVKVTWTDVWHVDNPKATSPDKKLAVVIKDDAITISRGKATKKVKPTDEPLRIGFADNLVLVEYKEQYGCGGGDTVHKFTEAYVPP
jgi:hypothetical protein